MKSLFTEFVIDLHERGETLDSIFEKSKIQFKNSPICFYQVERVVENFKNGMIDRNGGTSSGSD